MTTDWRTDESNIYANKLFDAKKTLIYSGTLFQEEGSDWIFDIILFSQSIIDIFCSLWLEVVKLSVHTSATMHSIYWIKPFVLWIINMYIYAKLFCIILLCICFIDYTYIYTSLNSNKVNMESHYILPQVCRAKLIDCWLGADRTSGRFISAQQTFCHSHLQNQSQGR